LVIVPLTKTMAIFGSSVAGLTFSFSW